jgi:hypothetical protein
MSRPGSGSRTPSRRGVSRPLEDKDKGGGRYDLDHNEDEVSPRSSNPSYRGFEKLIDYIPSDLVHKLGRTDIAGPPMEDHNHDHDRDHNRGIHSLAPIRRHSSLFSLQLPVSRRRLLRLCLLCSLVVLFLLTLGSNVRNRRRSRLIAVAGHTGYTSQTSGGFRWPAWVDAGSTLTPRSNSHGHGRNRGVSGRSEAGEMQKGRLGRKLRRSLQDLGLMPVFLDGRVDLPHPHSQMSGSGSDVTPPRRRLNPLTTPPGQLETEQSTQAIEEEGGEDEMPWFWGNVDEVGASPFDHWPELNREAGEKGKRVLFLTGTSRLFFRRETPFTYS